DPNRSVKSSHALASRSRMSQQEERVAAFRRLHEAGCFVMPNPWDVGSAVALEGMGFEALATTSAGNAWTLGVPDNGLLRDQTLAHLRQVVGAVVVPVNADFEGGFADDPLYPFDLAVERVRAARRAIDESGTGTVLTGRSEGFVVGRPDLEETIRRLQAYAAVGADCLYAPRIETTEQVSAVVAA